jgi:hypothetical protein
MKTTPNAPLSPGCDHQEALVTYLYDEATASERAAFEHHLDECAACRRELHACERVRRDLSAWQLPLAPPLEMAPPRGILATWRDLLGGLSFWPKAILGAAAMTAVTLVILALIGTRLSVGQGGFSVAFGQSVSRVSAPPDQMFTRAEAEALIQEAAARVRAQAQDETRLQLASLEERLNHTHQTELIKITRRLSAEQRTILVKANRQEQTLSEWLFAAGDSREVGGAENVKNK